MSHQVLNVLVPAQPIAPRGARWAAELSLWIGRTLRSILAAPRAAAAPEPGPIRLKAAARAAITRHLLALPAEDRGDRFMGGVDDAYVTRYSQRIDFGRDIVLGLVEGRRVVALAHGAISVEDGVRFVDVGLSVDAAARRRGNGRQLLTAVVDEATRRGVHRVVVRYRGSNRAMAALARSLGATTLYRWGEAQAVIDTEAFSEA